MSSQQRLFVERDFVENGNRLIHLRLDEQIKILLQIKSVNTAEISSHEVFTHSKCVFLVEFVKMLLHRPQ